MTVARHNARNADRFIAAAFAVAGVPLLSGCAPYVCSVAILTDSPVAVETKDDVDAKVKVNGLGNN